MLGVQYRSLRMHITTWNYRFGKGESLSAQAKIELFSAQHSLKTCCWYPRAAKVPNYSKAFKIIYICIYLIQTCWFLKSYIVIYIYLYLYLYIFAVLASHARIPTLCNRQKRCKLRNTSPNLDQLGAANKYKNIYCGLTERTSKRESKRYIITNIQIYKNFLCEKSKIHTTRTEHSIKIHTLFTKHQSQKVYAFQELKHRNIYFIYIYIYICV